MIIDILNKVLFFLLIFSSLNIIRHGFFLIKSFKDSERFILDKKSLIVLGMSISYVLLMIMDGIKL
jgi:hypothetical protein